MASTKATVVLLNLPVHSSVSIDGQSIVLKRDDFVGIVGIPVYNNHHPHPHHHRDAHPNQPHGHHFHFVAVRPCIRTHDRTNEPVFASITAGFFLTTESLASSSLLSGCLLMRKYDPHTEEISDEPLDEVTRTNLERFIQQQQQQQNDHGTESPRLISYSNIMRTGTVGTMSTPVTSTAWREATCWISVVLLRQRGIVPGCKIVPGAQDEQVTDFVNSTLQDGQSPRYPSIPVLDITTGPDGRGRRQSRITHTGTKAFLQTLSPTQRTALLMEEDPSNAVFAYILKNVYQNDWKLLLGDIQLSYLLFLHLHCYASLVHWRDTVALCCHVSAVITCEHADLFTALVQVLSTQVQTMESDFFDDLDLSSDNFFVPSLQRLLRTTLQSPQQPQHLLEASRLFIHRLQDRWPRHFGSDAIMDASPALISRTTKRDESINEPYSDQMDVEEDEDDLSVNDVEVEHDDDGPVVVSEEEVTASHDRNLKENNIHRRIGFPTTAAVVYPVEIVQQYPILFAARMPHEDILMTCARALDAANDVSLVREAAAYLEQIESKATQPSLLAS